MKQHSADPLRCLPDFPKTIPQDIPIYVTEEYELMSPIHNVHLEAYMVYQWSVPQLYTCVMCNVYNKIERILSIQKISAPSGNEIHYLPPMKAYHSFLVPFVASPPLNLPPPVAPGTYFWYWNLLSWSSVLGRKKSAGWLVSSWWSFQKLRIPIIQPFFFGGHTIPSLLAGLVTWSVTKKRYIYVTYDRSIPCIRSTGNRNKIIRKPKSYEDFESLKRKNAKPKDRV